MITSIGGGGRWRLAVMVPMIVACAACGPSTQQVQLATTAQYRASPGRMYDIALEVARDRGKIWKQEPDSTTFQTMPRWYGSDGVAETSVAGNTQRTHDGSLRVGLLVEVSKPPGQPDLVEVRVTPMVLRLRWGTPKPEPVPPGDPSMPGWCTGMADKLALEIYERAKNLAVAK